MSNLAVLEHSSPKYAPRTWDNARGADLTVAFAIDYETMGEVLTRKAAASRYLACPLSGGWLGSARSIYRELQRCNGRVLNIAGNGIATLSAHGWSQVTVNQFIFNVLSIVTQHRTIDRIVSGGQTGADLAGGIAGVALGIPTTMTLPAGCLQRDADGRDRLHTVDQIVAQVAAGLVQLDRAGTPVAAVAAPSRLTAL